MRASVQSLVRGAVILGWLATIGGSTAAVCAAAESPAAAAPATTHESAGDTLREAARAGDLAAVRAQLAAGVPADAPGRHGTTALQLAAAQGQLEVVRLLLDRGAAVDGRETFFGATALDVALMGKHRDVALLLLARGAREVASALPPLVEANDLELLRAVLASGGLEPLDLAAARESLPETASPELRALLASASAAARTRPPFTPYAARLRQYPGTYRGRSGEATIELRDGSVVLRRQAATPPGEGVPSAAAPPELVLRPVAEDHFETPDGTARVLFSGRAGLLEWLELNERGAVSGYSLVAAPDPVDLAAAPVPAGPAAATGAASSSSAPAEPAARAAARPWPQFRGALAAGDGDGQGIAFSWDLATGRNVRFKTAVPGIALSSPVIWGDRIFVTTAVSERGDATFRTGLYGDGTSVDDRSPHSFRLLALDARSGAVVWDREVLRDAPSVRRHLKSSLANATPATDGERVVVLFGPVGVLAAFDFAGKELWRRDVGVLAANDPQAGVAEWGHASSPIVHDGKVIVQADRRRDSFLAAYRLADGAELWKVARAEPSTWATPNVVRGPAGDELVTNGTTIRAYDPATGRELWSLGPNSEVIVGTPAVGDGMAYVVGGYPPVRPVYAVRAGSRGDLTLPAGATASAAVAWSYPRGGSYVPSPLLYRGHLYTLNNNGLLTAYRVADGAEVHRARAAKVGTAFSASPVAADGRLLLASEEGEVFVLRVAPELLLESTQTMGEVVMATPAIADGLLVVRTLGHVVGIATP